MSQFKTASRLIQAAARPPHLQALISGLVVFAVLVIADRLSLHYGLSESQRVIDDICGALVAALLVFRYERTRASYLRQRLETIALMNHHVRNALQVISYSTYLQPHEEQVAQMRQAVERIEWALREVLPGRVHNSDDDTWKKKPSTDHRPGGFSATA